MRDISMRSRNALVVLLAVALLAGLALVVGVAPVAAAGTSMSITPSAQTVNAGDTFTVQVDINSDQAITGAQCAVFWSPAGSIQCTGLTKGADFVAAEATWIPNSPTIDNAAGRVPNLAEGQASATIIGGSPLAAGTHTLFTLTIQAASDGPVNVTLGSAIVMDVNYLEIPGLTVANGTVFVSSEPVPDLAVTSLSAEFETDSTSTYSVSYTVKNQGDASVGAFKMGLYIDGAAQPLLTEDVTSLDAGTSYSGTFSGHAVQISGGMDQVRVCADSDSAIAEGLENNNCQESVIEQMTFTLRLQPSQGCYIEVEVDGEKLPSSQTSAYQVYLGTQVRATAVVNDGYEFTDWVGDLSGQPNPATFTMTQDYTLQAVATELSPQGERDGGGLSTPAIAGIIAGAGLVVAVGAYLAITRLKRNP